MGYRIIIGPSGLAQKSSERAHVKRLGQNAYPARIQAALGKPVQPLLGVIFADPSDHRRGRIWLPYRQANSGIEHISTRHIQQRISGGENNIIPGQLPEKQKTWENLIHDGGENRTVKGTN